MTNFAYNRNIPASPNNPSNDQPLMQTNTNSTDDMFAVNHISFNANNGGLHHVVQFDANTAAPGLGGGVAAFHSQLLTGQAWPVWENALGATQMLGLPNSATANGYYTLVGGIILQWGIVNAPGSNGTVNFPVNFVNPAFTIQLTPRNDGSHSAFTYYLDGAPSNTSFNYRGSTSGSNSLYWFAVGF